MQSLTCAIVRCASVFSKGRFGSSTVTPSLGMAYLAASLRQAGHSVIVVDAVGESLDRITNLGEYDILGIPNEEVLERIPLNTDIVAFSSMFSNEWIYLKQLIAAMKERNPRCITIAGGEHPSSLAEYCLSSCPALDYVGKGEGESLLVAFADAVSQSREARPSVAGLSYRHEGMVVTPVPAQRIADVDSIPLPAWELFPLEAYLAKGIATITRKGTRSLPVLATRGCPYNCRFCSSASMYGRHYRLRHATDVVNEILLFKERYRLDAFEFQDLTFVTKRKWVESFVRELIDRNANLEWNIPTTRSEALDPALIDLLRQSGCTNICLTPDTGSERTNREIRKQIDLGTVVNKARAVVRSGIILKVNLVFGFPSERHRDVWQTILLGMRLAANGVESVNFYRFVPYPGSDYFRELQEQRLLPPPGSEFDLFLIENLYNNLSAIRSWTRHVSNGAMRFYIYFSHMIVLLLFLAVHPLRGFGLIRRVLTRKPRVQIEISLIEFLERHGLLRARG